MWVSGHDFFGGSGFGLLEMEAADLLPFILSVSSPILTLFSHTSPKSSQTAPAYLRVAFLNLLPGLKREVSNFMEPSYLSEAINIH